MIEVSGSSYIQGFLDGLRPDPIFTVSEWADRHRVLSQKASAEPGMWQTSRTPFLKEIMDCLSTTNPVQEVVFMKGSQIGGALALDTKLPTPTGWTTMGDIKVGDFVFGENGRPCRVKFKSKIFKKNSCWEITFSDGTKVISDHLHKWQVRTYKGQDKVLDTPTLAAAWRTKHHNKYSVFVTKPLACKAKRLPIDPYLLGIWLGDGNRHTGILYLNRADCPEIMSKINRDHRQKLDSENCIEILVKGFFSELNKYGFLKQKSIPIVYLRASVSQRLALLKGLMDSDGSISKNRCEFSTVDESLKEGVYELLMTLGIKASVYEYTLDRGFSGGKRKSKSRPSWRISFTTFNYECFELTRKKIGHKKTGRISETTKRFVLDVKKVESVYTACIEVDSKSHLYLCTEAMIPTHNTETGNNWIGYVIDHSPGPMMAVQPTTQTAERNSKQRIAPLIEECPRLLEKVKSVKSKASGNTILQKDFPGGILTMTGANSAVGLRSMPARFLFLDEVDGYPHDVGGEGDPVALAVKRAATFSRRKIFYCSTPLIEGRSRIEDKFEDSDKRRFYVPCPRCGFMQWLKWSQVKWDKGDEFNAWYECEDCNGKIQNWEKTKMLEKGEWRAEKPNHKKGRVAGFHLSSLYSPVGWLSWGEAVDEWVNSQSSRERLRTFINTILGETWKDKGEAPDWKRLYERRQLYKTNEVPKGVCFLTAGADVQKDRIEVEVVGWGRNKISWSIDYRVFMGDTADINSSAWGELHDLLAEVWQVGEVELPIKKLAVDSGYNTQVVYSWVKKFPFTKVVAIKGVDAMSTMIGQPKAVDVTTRGKKLRHGLKMFPIGVSLIKSELYGWLRQPTPDEGQPEPHGFCHFPEYDEDYFKMLTAEELVVKYVKGYKKYEWEKIRDRNEALDCRIYARAAASLCGMDRYKDTHWTKLEAEVGIELTKETDQTQKNTNKLEKTRKKVTITRRKSSFL